MLAIRIYICTLTFLFLFLVIANGNLGVLQGTVVTCAILYLILDVRTDLQALRSELQVLKELEELVGVQR